MKKSLLALLMALVMVLPLFTSCGDKKPAVTGDQTASTDSAVTTSEDPDAVEGAEIDAYVKSLAADVDYNGKTFTFIGREGDNFPTEEDITGELLSDAVYSRQRSLEEIFGIDWENVITADGDETTEKVNQEVQAGGQSYDLARGCMLTVGQYLLAKNTIMDVSDFEKVDLTRDWWVASINDTYRIKDMLFFLTGPIVTNHFTDTECLLFNKDVAENYNVTGLYDLVKDGEWTFDKMFEVAEAVPSNEAGSGAYRFGSPGGIKWIFANGMNITKFDDDGTPYVDSTLPVELSNLADKLSKVFGDDTLTCVVRNYNSIAENVQDKYGVKDLVDVFINGNVLFWFDATGGVSSLREEDVEFGVLPIPKGDKSQSYRSYASSWAGEAVYVPKTVKDTEMVDTILEAMAALSQKYIKPAFYDKMLKGRSVYDSESREMIDIVFNTKVYDIIDIFSGGDMNSWGDFMRMLENSIMNDSSKLASSYAIEAKLVNLEIKNLIKKLEK